MTNAGPSLNLHQMPGCSRRILLGHASDTGDDFPISLLSQGAFFLMIHIYLFILFYFYVHWCFACLHVCMKLSDALKNGVADSCELPCGYRVLNQGPMEEQPVLLTSVPSLQPLSCGVLCMCVGQVLYK